MTTAVHADMKTLFESELTFDSYPALRDAALNNEGNTRQLEGLIEATDAKSSARAATKKGVALWILGRTQAAAEALAHAHPQEEVASAFLGRALVDLHKYGEAKLRYREALAKHPDSAPIAWGLVGAVLRLGELDEAKEILAKAEKRFGECADSLCLRGFHDELSGEYEGARKHYEAALAKQADHREALFRLAYHEQTWGDEAKAVELYEQLRGVQPTYANALLNLGNLYEDQQRWDLAVECYREVLGSVPNHPRAQMFLEDARASRVMFYDEEGERRADRQSAVLKIPVTDFELSVRSRNCLNKMNIRTLGDLIQMSEPELLAHKNFGETSLMEVKQMLAQKGLRLGQGKIEGTGSAMPAPAAPVELDEETLNSHIDTLDLSVRSRKCMERLGILTVGQLVSRTEQELLSAKNFGQTSLNEIKQRLEERGMRLKDQTF